MGPSFLQNNSLSRTPSRTAGLDLLSDYTRMSIIKQESISYNIIIVQLLT